MKDFVGIVLIVLAAMISESISQSKQQAKLKVIEKDKVEIETKLNSSMAKTPKDLGKVYQTLLDSTKHK